MEKIESNYEIMKKRMQAKFASYDMETVAKEWELRQEDGYLYTEFVCRTYRIDCTTGVITHEENGIQKEADYNVSMTLFDILTRKRQYSAGVFKPANSFSKVHLAAPGGSSGGMFQKHVHFFDQKDRELTLFCDNNILQFMHFETMMFMLIHVADRIYELVENEVKESEAG